MTQSVLHTTLCIIHHSLYCTSSLSELLQCTFMLCASHIAICVMYQCPCYLQQQVGCIFRLISWQGLVSQGSMDVVQHGLAGVWGQTHIACLKALLPQGLHICCAVHIHHTHLATPAASVLSSVVQTSCHKPKLLHRHAALCNSKEGWSAM